MEAWYHEVDDYNPNNPLDVQAAGHFTQLVWKSSLKLGVGAGQYYDGMGT